ncbi:DUF4276 family protein [Cellulosimicrobium funkei]|uniref:DUF4276 family protein n=1 Tax=Cellulosimicrobium funkei TaxID=264251 RepID=UPI00342F288D
MVATEGASEFVSLPEILKGVRIEGLRPVVQVIRVPCQPDGAARLIARAAEPSLKIAIAKRCDAYVLVLDREQRTERAGAIAATIKSEVERLGRWPFDVFVVMKDRAFENWLVADLNALRSQRARFTVTSAMARRVEPDKADRAPAIEMLEAASNGKSYDKKGDGLNIARRMDVEAAARHSRSFRHLLHVLQHDSYAAQCKQPV